MLHLKLPVFKVTETRDYLEDKIVDVATGKVSPTNLPKSNVLYFTLADDTWFCVKTKWYMNQKLRFTSVLRQNTVENAVKENCYCSKTVL